MYFYFDMYYNIDKQTTIEAFHVCLEHLRNISNFISRLHVYVIKHLNL